MKKFVIMTTAINRPELHNESILKMYEIFYAPYKQFVDETFSIVHVINIDKLPNPKLTATQEETKNNFDRIIPSTVEKIYNITETPSFLVACQNIMHKLKECDLLNENHIYWWLEDDWGIERYFNFFRRVHETLCFKMSAITMTRNNQIGSFRGGPVMSGDYFLNFFNLIHLKVMNNKKNPELQYKNYMRALKCYNPPYRIHRQLKNDEDHTINIVVVYHDVYFNRITPDFYKNYYESTFHKDIKIVYHIVCIFGDDYNKVHYLNCSDDDSVNIHDSKQYTVIRFCDIQCLNTNSITYISVKKYAIDDIGRPYMELLNAK